MEDVPVDPLKEVAYWRASLIERHNVGIIDVPDLAGFSMEKVAMNLESGQSILKLIHGIGHYRSRELGESNRGRKAKSRNLRSGF